jgi:hypothetical protein
MDFKLNGKAGLNVPSSIKPENHVEKVKPNFYPAQNALAKTHLISNALTDKCCALTTKILLVDKTLVSHFERQ